MSVVSYLLRLRPCLATIKQGILLVSFPFSPNIHSRTSLVLCCVVLPCSGHVSFEPPRRGSFIALPLFIFHSFARVHGSSRNTLLQQNRVTQKIPEQRQLTRSSSSTIDAELSITVNDLSKLSLSSFYPSSFSDLLQFYYIFCSCPDL